MKFPVTSGITLRFASAASAETAQKRMNQTAAIMALFNVNDMHDCLHATQTHQYQPQERGRFPSSFVYLLAHNAPQLQHIYAGDKVVQGINKKVGRYGSEICPTHYARARHIVHFPRFLRNFSDIESCTHYNRYTQFAGGWGCFKLVPLSLSIPLPSAQSLIRTANMAHVERVSRLHLRFPNILSE